MLSNQKGMAVFEIVPLLVLFVLLLNFVFGFFGIIHSGILNSIAARNYAFETFRNRTSLNYIRDESTSDLDFYFLKNQSLYFLFPVLFYASVELLSYCGMEATMLNLEMP